MDGKMLARLGAVVFVAIALTVAAIDRTRQEDAPVARSAPAIEPPVDPLRDEQRRCQQLGEAAAGDAECLRVWAETRDRFLGRTPPPIAPQSSEGR
ncbi:putative entry exclusion protein TrbK-alt [Pararhizobium haloflavum]|uniref:putative entry exclusion protein TrbK-alt n=1 Tax=Pararhizobium haloflavum TaxID=2037914 RepID=UPI000C19DE4F|nr:putative entry exclusion protein TrbK-alt [Pararhizobium haloflavum]